MPDDEHRIRVALELNALHSTGAFGDSLEGARIGTGTPIYDINGEQLYERIPLTGPGLVGYADVAVNPAMGAVLMAVSHGLRWNEPALLRYARQALAKQLPHSRDPDTARFVAYSYPKIGVQFRAGAEELALLELYSWRPVPREQTRPPNDAAAPFMPSNFERWSFLDKPPVPERLGERRRTFEARVREIEAVPGRHRLGLDRIARGPFSDVVDLKPRGPISTSARGGSPKEVDLTVSDGGTGGNGGVGTGNGGTGAGGTATAGAPSRKGELQFSTRGTNHATCYEIQGQATPVWCVAASVEMLLDFYRYQYTQQRLAKALGLGTTSNPNELPTGQESKVKTVIEAMTSNALKVRIKTDPTWDDFRDEIIANRPVISFVPGHARTVAGYIDTGAVTSELGPFRGLLVYDPWPPKKGVVSRWENIDVQIYTFAFMARLKVA